MRASKFLKITLAVTVLLFALPSVILAQLPPGVSVTCENGVEFNNGVEIIINQMRSGFTYRATAVGIDGFDPILAVLDESGGGLCSDDSPDAASYTLDLPTTGRVRASSLNSMVTFDQNSSEAFADISLVVGGYGDQLGEFVLVLEGMGVTSGDGVGDPFSIRLTPSMVASEVPLTIYMISRTNSLDPLMYRGDSDLELLEDAQGTPLICDDAGNPSRCWGNSTSLADSYVTTLDGDVSGGDYDAMLSFPLQGIELNDNTDNNFYNMVFTSFQQSTQGQYLLAFHVGLAEPEIQSGGSDGGKGASGGGENNTGSIDTAGIFNFGDKGGFTNAAGDNGQTDNASQSAQNVDLPAGVSVTCENGTSFSNGVEIRVVQMRSGFDYTATAIGLNGFDPILAVLDPSGGGLCSDDNSTAARYSANLPTTGTVDASNLSSQVTFSQNSREAFADISLVVGGYGDSVGEFILILEGMGVTEGDGAGDPFAVNVTPGMTASDVPLTVYMIARTNSLDPYTYLSFDGDIAEDGDGNQIYCDDAGNNALCYGDHIALDRAEITTSSGRVSGGQYDAMISLPLFGMNLNDDPEDNFLQFVMTSYNQSTTGQYVLVFHVGTAEVR